VLRVKQVQQALLGIEVLKVPKGQVDPLAARDELVLLDQVVVLESQDLLVELVLLELLVPADTVAHKVCRNKSFNFACC
jgi:hypothetical protein